MNQLTTTDDLSTYGPAMQALTELQRRYVIAFFEHPNYSRTALVREAGYSAVSVNSLTVTANRLKYDDRVIAAINEEADRRMQDGGVIGVNGVVSIALNPSHKDHLKACLALMDRTGRHATTEHKVIVDDKRPQTKQEMVDRVKELAIELGLGPEAIKKMTGEDVVDAEFKEVTPADDDIAKQMEDL